MFDLDFEKYTTVPVKFEKVLPWIVKEKSMEKLCHGVSHVKMMSSSIKETKDRNIFYVHDSYKSELTPVRESEVLKYLGLRSSGLHSEPFLKWEENFKLDEDYDLLLLTERSLVPYSSNLGSGRHILLPEIHLKGVGRNRLAIQEEFSHSWGGLNVRDAIKAFVIENYVSSKSKLGALEIYGIFLYEELNKGGSPYCMLVRDSRSYRLSQLHSSFLSLDECELVKDFLQNKFKINDPVEILLCVMDHYIHAYSIGIRYKSILPDNLLVDGRWIDTESIDIKVDWNSHDCWISVKQKDKHFKLNFERNIRVEDFYTQEKELWFCDSWIHQLRLMCFSTYIVYKNLWEKMNFDFELEFKKLIKKYFSTQNLNYWFDLLDKYESELAPRFGFPLKKKNMLKSSEILCGLNMRGFFENTQMKYQKMTFGQALEDPFEVTDLLVNKWEKLFWPTNLDFKNSFLLAKKIERMCGGK